MTDRSGICIFTEGGMGGVIGGAEIHTLNLIRSLLACGHKVTLIEGETSDIYSSHIQAFRSDSRFAFHRPSLSIKYAGLRRLFGLYKWQPFLATVNAEVALVIGAVDSATLPFLLLCRLRFRRVFMVQHSLPEPVPEPSLLRGRLGILKARLRGRLRVLHRRLKPLATTLTIAVSTATKRSLIDNCGFDGARIKVIHNGVETERFRRNEVRGKAFRVQHGVPDGTFVFGILARLSPEKGIDLAIQAMARLARQDSVTAFQLVIVGDGAQKAELIALAQDLGCQDSVTFLPFMSDVTAALSAFDSILMPSRAEALGLALLEGMAAGCIPIVTSVGGLPEVIISAELGWVVAPESPGDLALAMLELMQLEPEQRTMMQHAVVGHVRTHFEAAASYRTSIECMMDLSPSAAETA